MFPTPATRGARPASVSPLGKPIVKVKIMQSMTQLKKTIGYCTSRIARVHVIERPSLAEPSGSAATTAPTRGGAND
jgi:hypothetical protein